jgi:PGF-CTERM protein
VNVSAAANQTIEGETTVAPGTELDLRIRSSGDTQPSFLKTGTVYVTENNTFSGTFDFSEQKAGDTFDVTVRGGVADSETVEGNVAEGGANQTETDTNGTVTETGTMTETGTPAEGTETGTPAEGTETAAPTDGETGTPAEGTETGTSTGTPGFGVVVAVTALLAAAFVAVRRD